MIKPKLKIGFCDTHEHIILFFKYVLSLRYDIQEDNINPDFLIFGDRVFGEKNLTFNRHKVTKIFFTGENQRPDSYDCNYAITFDHNIQPWHYRLPLYVIYMWSLEHVHKTGYSRNWIFKPIFTEKTRFCSFVVSNGSCNERNEFFKKLNEIKSVDSGGNFMNNINQSLVGENAKIKFLSTRKFNICFESMQHSGYVTEKLLHAFYAGTVPIYWGSPSVDVDFNPKSFINVNDFKTFDEAIEYVLEVDKDFKLYNSYLEQPKFHSNVAPCWILYNNFLNWFDATVHRKILSR